MPARRSERPPLPAVFIGREAVEAGALTPRQLRGPDVVRVLQGVYRLASVPLTHELQCEAACLVLPDSVVVTGRSAATVLGVALARAGDEVSTAGPEGLVVPQRRGVTLRQARSVPLAGRTTSNGIRLADPRRIAFDLAARERLPDAVAHLDAVARAGLLDVGATLSWLATDQSNNVRAVRTALGLVDPRAESPPESVTRVVLHEAGFHATPQFTVTSAAGRFVARVDLALERWRIAVEYDGAWHSLREQLERDRMRLNQLQLAGWLVVHVTAAMLRDPAQVVAAVRAAVLTRTRAA